MVFYNTYLFLCLPHGAIKAARRVKAMIDFIMNIDL